MIWEIWGTPGLSETNVDFLSVEVLGDNYLYQHVLPLKRIKEGQEPLRLYLIRTNEEGMMVYLGKVTIPSLAFTSNATFTRHTQRYSAMRKEILKEVEDLGHTDWDSVLQSREMNANMQCGFIKDIVQEVI